jgi:hypothetical protein
VPGSVVERRHRDWVFTWIAAQQRKRDAVRLANPKITRRAEKPIQAPRPPVIASAAATACRALITGWRDGAARERCRLPTTRSVVSG